MVYMTPCVGINYACACTHLAFLLLQLLALVVALERRVADVDLVTQEVGLAALARTAHAHLLHTALGRRTGARVTDDVALVTARQLQDRPGTHVHVATCDSIAQLSSVHVPRHARAPCDDSTKFAS